ncbi:MAG: biliverdin-producing heme oxygenase [Moraxella sp.]|nr:biliverdin-producing heme oxygenase [Moraxella sp.]
MMNDLTLCEALKAHSRTTHDAVDALVMSMQPFASQDNYRKFLQAQYEFHRAVRPIYDNAELRAAFVSEQGGLVSLSRLGRVEQDMANLGVTPFETAITVPSYTDTEAIGWLYCVEGSNVGAAILYKEAGKIELDEGFGATHLAAHADGRMPHWRNVKACLNAILLSESDRQAAMKGADDAFAYFKQLIRTIYSVAA